MRWERWISRALGIMCPSIMSLYRSLTTLFATFPPPLKGALWMVAGCSGLGGMNVLVRYISTEVHPFEIAFFRNLGQLVFMLPWLMSQGFLAMRTQRLGAHVIRSLLGLAAMLCWFTTLSIMPVAEATALSFTVPLFATVGAALFLRETVRLRRWSATFIGLLGALIILRPGFVELTEASVLALISAAFIASAVLMTKSLSRTESAARIVLYTALIMTPLSLIPAVFVWELPSPAMLFWLVVIGGMAAASHMFINLAFASSDASAVMPYDFVRLPVAAVIGYMAFGEGVDVWTWLGAAVIFISAVYVARREIQLARQSAPPVEGGKEVESPKPPGP